MRLLLNILILALSTQPLLSQVELWNPQEVICYPKTTTNAVPEMRESPSGLFQVRVLGEEQELPNLEIVSLYEDRRGSLWIGLMVGGLLRYNGHELELFDSLDFFRTKTIMAIEEDQYGNLWFATFGNGLIKYDGKCFYQYSEESGFPGDHVMCLYRSPAGKLMAGLNGEGLIEIEKDGFRSSAYNELLPGKKVWSALVDRSGATWVGLVDKGLYRFHNDSVQHWNTTTPQALPNATVRTLYEDFSGDVWAGTNEGTFSIKRNGEDFQLQLHPELPKQVYDIKEIGHELWFGSNLNGIAIKNQEDIHYLGFEEGLVNLRIKRILPSGMGNIWMGSLGGGIMRIDNYAFRNYYVENGVPEAVRAIGELPSGEILVSPESGGLFINNGLKFIPFPLPIELKGIKCWDILCQSDGSIWLATDGNGVICLKEGRWNQWDIESAYGNRFLSLTHDKNQNIIAGGYQGLIKITSDLNARQIMTANLNGVEIWDLFTDSEGRLWIGTDGKGIWTLDDKEQLVQVDANLNVPKKLGSDLVITSFSEEKRGNLILGLENDGVGVLRRHNSSLYLDIYKIPNFETAVVYSVNSSDGFHWIGTSKGLFYVKDSIGSNAYEYFGRSDGIRSVQASTGKVLIDSNKHLWWATEKHLIEYDPLSETQAINQPEAVLESILFQSNESGHWIKIIDSDKHKKSNVIYHFFKKYLFLDSISHWQQIPNGLKLSYDKNKIKLKFTSSSWNKSHLSTFSHRLLPIEQKWSINETNEIVYERLPSNKYTFQVRSRNKNLDWSIPETFTFTITPPFWKTTPFFFLVTLIILFALREILKWRTNSLIMEKTILEEIVRERTIELVIEKNKTEKLLLNILPAQTAEELKSQGAANTRNYSQASVLFSDFKGFTGHSEQLSPDKLIKTLDAYFIAFDDAANDLEIEKIKTIGDSYMCASGIPTSHPHHAILITAFGLKMLEITDTINKIRVREGESPWNIRIGIHSGPLVAGVVGKKKYAYDIWGDTVNIASRMESSGEMNKLNISAQTKSLIEDYFIVINRGEVAAKNKGLLEMYFVEGYKPHFADKINPLLPSEKFFEYFNITRT